MAFETVSIVSTRNGVSPVTGTSREDLAAADVVGLALSSMVGVTSVRWELVGRPELSAAGGAGPEPILLATAPTASFTVDSDAGAVHKDGTYVVRATINPGSPGQVRKTAALARLSGLSIPGGAGTRPLRKPGAFEALEDGSVANRLCGYETAENRWHELLLTIATGGGVIETLAGAYSVGGSAADQTLVLDDAKGGGVVINAAGGGFTGASALRINTAAGGPVVVSRATAALGIGTATPAQALHVVAAAPAIRLERTGNVAIDLKNVTDDFQIINATTGPTILATFPKTGGMRADLGVGIGAAAPTAAALAMGAGSAAPISIASTMRFRFNEILQRTEISENAAPYVPLGSGGPRPGEFWVVAVDYDGTGSDTTGAIGVSTVMATALASATATPFKTFERAAQVIPRDGNGAALVQLAKPRASAAAYRNIANSADQDGTFLNALQNWHFLTRGSLDFANDTNDKIRAGFLTASGTNAGGYAIVSTVRAITVTGTDNVTSVPEPHGLANVPTWVFTNGAFTSDDVDRDFTTTGMTNAGTRRILRVISATTIITDGSVSNETFSSGSPTATVKSSVKNFTCQLSGGGAPAFPAESGGFSALTGVRIRFKVTSSTVALQNLCVGIVKNTTTSIKPMVALPVLPVAGDEFVVETPGVTVANLTHVAGLNRTFCLVGFNATGTSTMTHQTTVSRIAGCNLTALTCSFGKQYLAAQTYVDEADASINVGYGFRATGTPTFSSTAQLAISASSWLGPSQMSIGNNVLSSSVGSGCVTVQGYRNNTTCGPGVTSIGAFGAATTHRFRVTGNTMGSSGGVHCGGLGARIFGVDSSNCTSAQVALDAPNAAAGIYFIDDLVSPDGGNVGGASPNESSVIRVQSTKAHDGMTVICASSTIGAITATADRGILGDGGLRGRIEDLQRQPLVFGGVHLYGGILYLAEWLNDAFTGPASVMETSNTGFFGSGPFPPHRVWHSRGNILNAPTSPSVCEPAVADTEANCAQLMGVGLNYVWVSGDAVSLARAGTVKVEFVLGQLSTFFAGQYAYLSELGGANSGKARVGPPPTGVVVPLGPIQAVDCDTVDAATPIYGMVNLFSQGRIFVPQEGHAASSVVGNPTGAVGPAVDIPISTFIGGPFTPGSVIFAGAGGTLAQDNANFFWDDTLNRLGIGTPTPLTDLDISRNGTTFTGVRVVNAGASTTAGSQFFASNGTNGASVGVTGTAFVASAPNPNLGPGTPFLLSGLTASNALYVGGGAAGITMQTGASAVERLRILGTGEVQLSSLVAGGLVKSVAGQLAIATPGTDYLQSGATFVTTSPTSLPPGGFSLGTLTTGLLKITVTGSVATPSTAVAGTDYAPVVTLTAGTGLTGGGTTAANRTFDVGANADGSIAVGANDIGVGVLANDTQHGARGGGTQHAVVTTLVAGFMSAADKANLDGLVASSGVPSSRQIISGAGLTGGGDLTADRTLNVVAGNATITVNANDIVVGTIGTTNIAANSVTMTKLEPIGPAKVIGFDGPGAGTPFDISVIAPLRMVAGSGQLTFGTGFTAGSVVFQGASQIAEDNANFFWNNALKRLGIGTATPTTDVDVQRNVNGPVVHRVGNTSAAALADMGFTASNGTTSASFGIKGTGYTPLGSAPDLGANVSYVTAGGLLYLGTGGGAITLQTGLVTQTDRLRILSTGEVGIGTSTPSTFVEVLKNVNNATTVTVTNANAGANAQCSFTASNTSSNVSFGIDGTGSSGGFGASTAFVSTGAPLLTVASSAGDVSFLVGGAPTERMRILQTGEVVVVSKLVGGTGPVANLVLQSTTNGIRGGIVVNDSLGVGRVPGVLGAAPRFAVAGPLTVGSSASATLDYVVVNTSTITITGGTNITTATGFNMVSFEPPAYAGTMQIGAGGFTPAAATVVVKGPPTISGGGNFAGGFGAIGLWCQGAGVTSAVFEGSVAIGQDPASTASLLLVGGGINILTAGTAISLSSAVAQTIFKGGGGPPGHLTIGTLGGAGDFILAAAGIEAFRLLGTSSGMIQLGAISLSANGTVATAMASVGPPGSHTTPQEWMHVRNLTGVERWIPLF